MTRYCSGVSSLRHSSSVRVTAKALLSISVLLLAQPSWSISMSLHLQFDDFRTHPIARHADPGDRDRQLEAARTGAAGIEKQDPMASLDQRLMGMSIHHRGVAHIRRIEIKLRNFVEHIKA